MQDAQGNRSKMQKLQYDQPIRPNVRSLGTSRAVSPTTARAAVPPSTTAGTAPTSRAATPDSNAPSSFDEPMKMELTAETRPSICGGVSSWMSVDRMTTLTLSAIPLSARSAKERKKSRESPKPMMESAK